jgi:cell division septation protein DedD
MDWLRRNWPDLAIGVALVAVIAGIVATLLTGGSFFPGTTAPPTQAGGPPLPSASPTGAVTPGGVRALPPTGLADTESPAALPGTPAGEEPAEPDDASPAATPQATAPADSPAAGSPAAPAPAAGSPAAPAPAATVTPLAPCPAPAAQEPVAPTLTAPTPAPAAPAATAPDASPAATALPTVAADPTAPYRVSVGAYSSSDNAERQAEAFRAAGYPVFTGAQGALTLVLVGPYETEADAEQTVARIRDGGFGIDPVIYRFRPDAATAAASTPAPSAGEPALAPGATDAAPAAATTAPAAAPAATAPAAATPATATAGRYLQVGAYLTVESSLPQRDRLAGLGFAATERREDGYVKLLVGPFAPEALADARDQLAAQGIESFVR